MNNGAEIEWALRQQSERLMGVIEIFGTPDPEMVRVTDQLFDIAYALDRMAIGVENRRNQLAMF